MDAQYDSFISQITVRLKNKDNSVVGTGVIYYHDNLEDKVYILTASHCLFEDGDSFSKQRDLIIIDIYNTKTATYNSIDKNIDSSLLYKDGNKDVALLIFDKDDILPMIGLDNIPSILVIQERHSFSNFVTKGFPRATQGKELETLYLKYPRGMTEVNKFQLETTSSYTDSNMEGFSGSGVFLLADNEMYLYGIFTRYRNNPDEKGRVAYCQYIEPLNEILNNKHLPAISYTYIGENGLTRDFFQTHIEKSVSNLGGRFNQKLNFRLPIGQVFNALSYNNLFKSLFLKIWDDWLTARYQSYNLEGDALKDIKEQLYLIRKNKIKWVSEIKFDYRQELEVKAYKNEIQGFDTAIRNKIDELSKLESKEKNDYQKYQNERSWLIDILQINQQLLKELDSIHIELVNKPILIIKGDAGSGKSHLLGDIANERIKNNLPTLLLLGQHFHSAKTIEENILSLLHLGCTFTELLINLDKISDQIGSRVLILIDAINEGAGSDLWNNQIAGFISSIKKYKGVGIALSIRSTYFDDIISADFIEAESPHIIEHKGFKGNEYEALKLFCEYYSLKLPSFPILAPEFSNPLFLHLICNTVKEMPDKTFPKGFNGLNRLYQLYIDSLNKRFENKNKEYKLRSIVSESIEIFATSILNSEFNSITIQEAVKLFDEKFPNHKTLLTDLIDENILIRNKVYSGYNKYHDAVYFAYQRLGDYFMAQKLLNGCASKKDVLDALMNPDGLGVICSDYDWKYRGIIEALSIILPEEHNLEIFEISDYFISDADKEEEWKTQHIYEWISRVELDSLKWRKVESINDEKITSWLRSGKALISDHEWFLCLTELSSIIDHPFNSNRLTQILKKYTMAERDSFWQEFIIYFNGYDDNEIAFPIQRLIDWAWMPNISTLSDDETAKLVSQTLAWILSTTNTKLRDQTTKALVNLLEQKPNVLIGLLKTFQDVDDLYILERLYAVTYGCVLRTEKDESVKLIAEYVYNTIFKNGNPPTHVLLRDYACNTIEYAIHKCLLEEVDIQLIRPPYNSKMNFTPLTNEELDERYEPKKDRGHWGKAEWGVSAILRSMVTEYGRGTGGYGDFGRYTFQSAISNFDLPRQMNVNLLSNLAVEWIFEKYGYSTKLHGKYDDYIATKGDRHESKIERIGKKYQWIAFYEIVGIIADNYKMKCYWEDEYVYFKGTWQLYLRDIDPATTTINNKEEDSENSILEDYILKKEWWMDRMFSNWSGEDSHWVSTSNDLVHPYSILRKKDDLGNYWLHLHHYIEWVEPKKMGIEKYAGQKKQIWYIFNAYLVKKEDKNKIVEYLSQKNFDGRWMPEANEGFSQLINREKFWSPAYQDENQESKEELWDTINGTDYKVIVADTEANGNIEQDKSGTSAVYRIPCEFIFEGMELQYAPKDGDLKNKEGEIIVTNINPNGVMIREKDLLEFLDKNDLDLIWTLLGEKFSFSHDRLNESFFKTMSGVFYLEEDKMKGEMKMYDRE
ncbi:hypothetical protein ETU08_08635 [Apibacter muscae]|uniref:hypothetical protein n=1 Tax=Apibacter muscae TaxID=2509004 RepID=UPI0011AC7C4B|nr:hypothetical protein [Apibacter muscae]TWP28893.1 hypothetical protein ETU08_08635 [Apibacter muscae]